MVSAEPRSWSQATWKASSDDNSFQHLKRSWTHNFVYSLISFRNRQSCLNTRMRIVPAIMCMYIHTFLHLRKSNPYKHERNPMTNENVNTHIRNIYLNINIIKYIYIIYIYIYIRASVHANMHLSSAAHAHTDTDTMQKVATRCHYVPSMCLCTLVQRQTRWCFNEIESEFIYTTWSCWSSTQHYPCWRWQACKSSHIAVCFILFEHSRGTRQRQNSARLWSRLGLLMINYT